MIPLNASETKPMEFSTAVRSHAHRTQSPKIAWLHSKAPARGVTYDITIRDALGRVKMEKKGCGNEGEEYGELVNLPTLVGEELTIEVDNIKGAASLQVFLN